MAATKTIKAIKIQDTANNGFGHPGQSLVRKSWLFQVAKLLGNISGHAWTSCQIERQPVRDDEGDEVGSTDRWIAVMMIILVSLPWF